MEYEKMPFSESDEILKRIEKEQRIRALEMKGELSPEEIEELTFLKKEQEDTPEKKD